MWFTRFLAWFSRKYDIKPEYFTGLIDDPRPAEEKQHDYLHEERVFGPAVGPFDNRKITTPPYPDEDQGVAGSCVPHGVGKGLAIELIKTIGIYNRLSWSFVYRLRLNYPNAGSWLQNIFDIYKNTGAPLFTTLPDPRNETEANALVITDQMRREAAIYKGGNYFQLANPNNIDAIADIAASGHTVAIIFYSTVEEWTRPYPTVLQPNLARENADVRHCVAVLPFSGFMENGIKYVVVQDSARWAYDPSATLHYLSEDFIRERVFGAGYWTSAKVLATGPKPKHVFTKVLSPGMKNMEVTFLQRLLISEGFLPADCASGFFGGLTLAGLHAFQNKYASEILIPLGLDAPTDRFGSACIAVANRLCA